MRFMIPVKANADPETGAARWQKLLGAMMAYHERLRNAGVLVDASGPHSASKAWRIKYSGTRRTVTDGPFAETKELIAG